MPKGRIGTKPDYPPFPAKFRDDRQGAFSQGGRLLQVEYARECPASGPLALALRFRSGVLLAKGRTSEPELGHRIPLTWPVTPTSVYVANGNLGDMFYLFDRLRQRRAGSRDAIAASIRGILHEYAVRRDVRPLALMVLLGSVDRGEASVTGFDVTGSQWEADAWAIGERDLRARDVLRKRWTPGLTLAQARDLTNSVYRNSFVEVLVLQRPRGG